MGQPDSGGSPGKDAAGSARLIVNPEDTFTVMGMRGTGKTTLCAALSRLTKSVVIDPLAQYAPDVSVRLPRFTRREVDAISARCWAASPIRMIVEEAEQVFPNNKPLPPASSKFCLMGRNLGSSWGMNTRRPQDLSKALLDNSDHLFIFKLSGRAIRYMVDYVSDEAEDEQDGARISGMRAWVKDPRAGGGRFFHYHDGKLDECEPLKVARPKVPQRPAGK